MFTDIVGYTALTQADEESALRLLREQEDLVRPLLPAYQGREIKATGDGFLVEFESALRAVQCAIDIQQHFQERNARAGVQPIQLRIGIHLGDVEERGGDVYGDAVNIASRIQPLARPGGICLSAEVSTQLRGKIPNRFEKLESKPLKGLRLPVDVFRVVLPWETPEPTLDGSARPRLAVLPLTNISPDPSDEYFADGLTEELISSLSRLRGLRVIARTSVGQYKSTSKTVAQIGDELGVSSVLEGSVRKAGNRLRITLQLIDAGTQDHIWASSYDRELDDVFAIQTEIAEKTASALKLELLPPERESIQKEPTTNIAAYDLYLQGIHIDRQSVYEGLTESIPFFEEAIRTDPGFSQAYAHLANVLIGLAGDTLPAGATFRRAQELVARALELDPNSSDAHLARGNLALQHDLDWETAEAGFKRAISLNPSNANAHLWYAFLLRSVERYDDALREFRATAELDPLWPVPQWGLRTVQCLLGDTASAIVSAEAARDREPANPYVHVRLGHMYADAGRMDDALVEAELSAGSVPTRVEVDRAYLWVRLGKSGEARRLLEALEAAARARHASPSWIAGLYAAIGEKEKALEWLERDGGEGAKSLWLRHQWSAYDPIRDDPRFRSMLERLHLPTGDKPDTGRPGPGRPRPPRQIGAIG